MRNCKICDRETETGFNIGFNLVPICEDCAASIFIQQSRWYVSLPVDIIIKGMRKDADIITEHFNLRDKK